MGSKSQIRSMQRGALKRETESRDKTPDYENFKPQIRASDLMCLGVASGKLGDIMDRTAEKVNGFRRAGYRKSADVARLLNRAGVRTAVGTEWSPRLVWFLMRYLHENGRLDRTEERRPSWKDIEPREKPAPPDEDMESKLRRLAAKWGVKR